jgi:transposase
LDQDAYELAGKLQKLDHAEQRITFEEMLLAVREAQARVARLEQAIRVALPDWSLAELVTALMAMRGFDLVSASAFLADCARVDGLSRPGAERAIDRREDQASRHHQSR